MERKHTPIHLRPHAPVAERVIAPGDPGRALRLAQALIDRPRMLNHHRGLWGYSGPAKDDGALLTIQSTGLGGPSAAAVMLDLAVLGARRVIRVGTCAAVDAALRLGDLVVPARVLNSHGPAVSGDAALTARLRSELPGALRAALASVDLAHADAPAGATARDMTSAGLLAEAARSGLAAGVAVVVARADEARLDDERLHASEARLGRAAARALA